MKPTTHRFRVLMHVEVYTGEINPPTEHQVKRMLTSAMRLYKALPEFHDVDHDPRKNPNK